MVLVLAAAQLRGVHHVVVEQGGGVDELDDGGELDVAGALVAAGARGEQQHHGAHHVLGHEGADGVEIHGRGCLRWAPCSAAAAGLSRKRAAAAGRAGAFDALRGRP